MRKIRLGALALLLSSCAHVLPDGLYGFQGNHIDATAFVPLQIEGDPEVGDASGKKAISVALAPAQAAALEEFTRRHLGESVAIFVDGKVVSRHKVREVVRGGRLQISLCTPERCTFILSKLSSTIR
jgi:hypothetical protein